MTVSSWHLFPLFDDDEWWMMGFISIFVLIYFLSVIAAICWYWFLLRRVGETTTSPADRNQTWWKNKTRWYMHEMDNVDSMTTTFRTDIWLQSLQVGTIVRGISDRHCPPSSPPPVVVAYLLTNLLQYLSSFWRMMKGSSFVPNAMKRMKPKWRDKIPSHLLRWTKERKP